MLFLSKEASNKDLNLKTQIMILMKEDETQSSTEHIWKENGFFKDQRTDLTIAKANFPENTLKYVNNGSMIPVKGRHAMYLEFVITGKILPMANPPPGINLDKHDSKDNEVLIYTPPYNTEIGLYRGLTKKLGIITLRGDLNESFYSYGFDKKNSKVLFCTVRQLLPNIFQCTAFKKHLIFLMSQNQEHLKFSKMFMFLPSTLDQKEKTQQFNDNVNLHPVDVSYEQL